MGASSSKPKPVQILSPPPDLANIDPFFGYKRRALSELFQPVIPANAISTMGRFASADHTFLDLERLSQTHIVDLDTIRVPSPSFAGSEKIQAAPLIKKIHCNVGALCFSKGIPFASCILVAPNIILTARHAIEGIYLRKIELRLGYELYDWGLNLGDSYLLDEIIEESAENDWVLIRLTKFIPEFKRSKFNWRRDHLGSAILISHPNGEPKQAAIHASSESDQYMLSYNAFHDSYPGSSGGAYFNKHGEIFALHTLFDSGTTAGLWLADIYKRSLIIQTLVERHKLNDYVPGRRYLPIQKKTEMLRLKLERRLKRPVDMPNINSPGQIDMKYHHIIPIGDMEFLWLLGQENGGIYNYLKKLSWQQRIDINSTAYAPWVLFIGPAQRSDDPEDGEIPERRKPISFDEALWLLLTHLYKLLKDCWEVRQALQIRLTDIPPAPEEVRKYRKRVTGQLQEADDVVRPTFSDAILERQYRDSHGREEQKRLLILAANNNYEGIKRRVLAELININELVMLNPNYLHQYVESDWLENRANLKPYSLK